MNVASLFAIAVLDKFSFNGIRALLILYLVTHLHLSDALAYKNYAAVMALAFLMPLICGYLADKFLYSKHILFFGSLWSGLGLFLLFIPRVYTFHVAIAALIVGSGFIKTLIPSLLGTYATEHNKNQDALYSKLYVFFNLGAFLGTLGCSVLGEMIGWNYGFLMAGSALLIASGLAFFMRDNPKNLIKHHKLYLPLLINISIAFLISASFALLAFPNILSYLLYAAFVSALLALLMLSRKESGAAIKNIRLLFFLMIIHTIFFALYEQSSLSLMLFTDRIVDRSLSALLPFLPSSSFQIPVTFFQTIDPIFNVILGGAFVMAWEQFAARRMDFSYVGKFCLGLLIIATAFLILGFFPKGNMISPWWIVLTYMIFVLGEQCVVPIGFSAVNSLSPKSFIAFCMGVWFVAIAISEWLAEWISKMMTPSSATVANLGSYQHTFLLLASAVIGLTFIFYVFYYARKWMMARQATSSLYEQNAILN